jgi:DNA polymerase III delta prime subunit
MFVLPKKSDKQIEILKLIKNNNIIIDSVAGSGKTTTALHIALDNLDKKILLLTYNARLKLETREKVFTLKIPNMEVHSYHAFAVKYYIGKDGKNDKGISMLLENDISPQSTFNYDLIIIDEAQDINKLYYNLINKIIEDNSNKTIKLCLIGDEYQTIFDTLQNSDKRYLKFADKLFNINKLEWKKVQLNKSYRITQKMAKFINTCILKKNRIFSDKICNDDSVNYLIINTFSANNTFNVVETYMDKGYKPNDIFILAPSIKKKSKLKQSKSPLNKLENKLSEKYPVYIPVSDEQKITSDVMKGKIVISTFHQIKGMERPVVFVFNFDDTYFKYYNKNCDVNFCPDILYVALTRAIDHLVIFHHSTNDFMPFINREEIGSWATEKSRFNPGKNAKTYYRKHTCPTELVNYLNYDVTNKAMKFITITKEVNNDLPININNKIKSGKMIEEVSEINGIAIPFYFELIKTGKISIVPDKKFDIENINIEQLLKIATEWSATKTNYKFKLNQIKKYDWLTNNQLKLTYDRLSKYIKTDPKIECRFSFNILDYTVNGFVDCISDDIVWEFKCCTSIKNTHILQLAIYMYAFLIKYPESKHKFKLLNILSGEVIEITSDISKLSQLIKYLIIEKFYKKKHEIDDETFIKLNTESKIIEKYDRKYIMILDIETTKSKKIIQIAYWIYCPIKKEIIKKKNLIVNDGSGEVDFYKMISIDVILRNGKSLKKVMEILLNDMNNCSHIIGHNIITFDMKHIKLALDYYYMKFNFPIPIDTMKITKHIVCAKNKRGNIKMPKLSELYKFLCATDMDEDEAHDAFYDVFITFECVKKLINLKVITF